MKTALIPTFAADGRRLRAYSIEAAEHLEALSFVSCKRSRKGVILAIFFRDQDGGSALNSTLKAGQRYSYLSHAGDTRIWQHQEIETGAADFCRVALDIAA